jgi:hypothetical protein
VRPGVVCTLAVGDHSALLHESREPLETFAARHRRDLVVVDSDVAGGRPAGWGKLAVIREMLDRYDEVVWVDADAVVVDGRADICAPLTRLRPLGIVFHRYRGLEVPNLGVIALRSTAWTRSLVEALWRAGFEDHPWMDNAALLPLLGYDLDQPRAETRRRTAASARVVTLDLAWNSIPACPARRPRIAHFPGLPHPERLRLMREAAASAA